MKKIFLLLFCTVTGLTTVCICMANAETQIQMNNNDLLKLNIEALSIGDDGEYPRYKNVTDKSSNTEFKTEIKTGDDGTQVTIEYNRTCTVWCTYCKHTGRDEDICYASLNGIQQGPCGEWNSN